MSNCLLKAIAPWSCPDVFVNVVNVALCPSYDPLAFEKPVPEPVKFVVTWVCVDLKLWLPPLASTTLLIVSAAAVRDENSTFPTFTNGELSFVTVVRGSLFPNSV